MAKNTRKRKEDHRKKQASALLSIIGVISLTAYAITASVTHGAISMPVLAIFAAISLPQEVLARFFKVWRGGSDDKN